MSTRENIIDAAMTIVRDQGVARLTLDEAAKVAGLSKGGVLYHFKSKDDLIRGMVTRLIDQCEALHDRYYADEPHGPYRWARTMVRAAFDPRGPSSDPVGSALLAAVAVNPALMEPVHAKYDEWRCRIESDSPDPERAAVICMAMDGLFFRKMLGLGLRDQAGDERLKQATLALLT